MLERGRGEEAGYARGSTFWIGGFEEMEAILEGWSEQSGDFDA